MNDSMRFVDDLYEANPGVLPPKSMVTGIAINIAPGNSFAEVVVTLVGLRMPPLRMGIEDLPIVGENGAI